MTTLNITQNSNGDLQSSNVSKKITVVTAFNRKENLKYLLRAIEGKANWTVLVNDDFECEFPSWVDVKRYKKEFNDNVANRFLNEFIRTEARKPENAETQYFTLNDDDLVEEGFFDKIPEADVVIVSMQRTDVPQKHIVWDDWDKKIGHYEEGIDFLKACPENMKVGRVGGDQLIIKGKIWKNFRNGLQPDGTGDGVMICQIAEEYPITYVSEAVVYFNYLEDGRWKGFRRRPQALFIGDYYRGASVEAGPSEWEGGIWQSLESTGLADVARFHFDKYWWEVGMHNNGNWYWWGDKVLRDRIDELKPDFIINVMYKAPNGADPSVISLNSLEYIKQKGIPVYAIWGDLESVEQRWLARAMEPWHTKNFATANKAIAEKLGYTYLHVPRDPRIFNPGNFKRDTDVIFSGSFGLGREDRQKVLKYLEDNGINLVKGGSECGDHYPTQEYADKYKKSKMALSFATACGVDVVNARVFEVMHCGALLMNHKSEELTKLYTPGVDYVEWTDEVDLLNKVRYYLEHEEERLSIAANGCKKTQELYSAKTFWEKVLER